jgi:putative hydrolase
MSFIFHGYRGRMTDLPFGFTGGGGEGGAGGAPDLGAMLHQLGDLMSGQSGPVNWNLARQSALQVIGASAGTTSADAAAVTEAIRLADVWLDPQTTLPSGVTATEAWSRRRWLEATQPAWTELVEPVASRVMTAMGDALPEEVRAAAAPLMSVMQQVGGLMFGGQLGQALGTLATEVVSSTDIGLQLGPAGVAALVPENVAAFGAGLEVAPDEVRLFLALREAAHHRLFGHVPWLRGRLVESIRGYAQGITIDMSRLEELSRSIDPSDPASMQQAITEGMFEPQNTPEQQTALARLEALLALVEGWVDTVTLAAAANTLPSIAPLNETMRRRRATGGPAEQTFATLVGLELRPRRLRDAAALWALLETRRGVDGRDAVWAHPDLMPTVDDLDDPFAFVDRDAGPDIDMSQLEGGTPEDE